MSDSAAESLSHEEYRRQSRRALLVGGSATVAGLLGWRWIQTQPTDDRIPGVLRSVHETNESIWSALFREGHLAPTFPADQASVLRVNGRHGIREEIDLASWELRVEGHDGVLAGNAHPRRPAGAPSPRDDHRAQVRRGLEPDHHLGRRPVQRLGGQYGTEADRDYVSLVTPDGEYYVGLDRATMMHPQTLLVDQMVGRPLDQEHGAPLRLATALKYGIKQIKRIGSIRFTDDRPADYWAERGYDWYAGL